MNDSEKEAFGDLPRPNICQYGSERERHGHSSRWIYSPAGDVHTEGSGATRTRSPRTLGREGERRMVGYKIGEGRIKEETE